jgi:prophage antirepressor-like protein
MYPNTFEYNNKNIRVLYHNNKTWFVEKDIHNILDIKDIVYARSLLNGDEKAVSNMYTDYVDEYDALVSKLGVYALVELYGNDNHDDFVKFIEWVC